MAVTNVTQLEQLIVLDVHTLVWRLVRWRVRIPLTPTVAIWMQL